MARPTGKTRLQIIGEHLRRWGSDRGGLGACSLRQLQVIAKALGCRLQATRYAQIRAISELVGHPLS